MKNWSEVKDARMREPGARAGFERARRAYELGSRVRELREAAGLSQAELARAAGTSQSAVARLEGGGSEPRLSTLERIGEALGARLSVELVSSRT